MIVEKFEDLTIWKDAQNLSYEIYLSLTNNRDFSYVDQIKRAALSISNNIAEGFERNSRKEFSRFLKIAKGSCGEVRSMIYFGKNMNYFTSKSANDFINKTTVLSKRIGSLIAKLN